MLACPAARLYGPKILTRCSHPDENSEYANKTYSEQNSVDNHTGLQCDQEQPPKDDHVLQEMDEPGPEQTPGLADRFGQQPAREPGHQHTQQAARHTEVVGDTKDQRRASGRYRPDEGQKVMFESGDHSPSALRVFKPK